MAHIYEKGQLVIPKYFRDLLGWTKDTEVSFEVQKGGILITKKTSIVDEMEQMAKEWDVGNIPADTDELYNKITEEEMRKKYKKMGIEF